MLVETPLVSVSKVLSFLALEPTSKLKWTPLSSTQKPRHPTDSERQKLDPTPSRACLLSWLSPVPLFLKSRKGDLSRELFILSPLTVQGMLNPTTSDTTH
jgi:hypothetical protein